MSGTRVGVKKPAIVAMAARDRGRGSWVLSRPRSAGDSRPYLRGLRVERGAIQSAKIVAFRGASMHRWRVQPLGKNTGGYFGEHIDIREVLHDDAALAREHGWSVEELPATDALRLLALRRTVPQARRRVYLSAGIHGDEPAGPLAARELLRENIWPADADIWLCPCLNPIGCERRTRENGDGIDLNRDYRHLESAEIRAHVRWLEQQPRFDLVLCLHEDWESHGFYIYELNAGDQPPLGPRIVQRVETICPVDRSAQIDGWTARDGVITTNLDPESRPKWAEAFYLFVHKTRHSCTLEAPSDFALATRVAALVAGVRTALEG